MTDSVARHRSDAVRGLDLATIIGIGALAYALGNVVHEGLGHGGACLLVGARPTMFNAIFFNYDEATAGPLARRIIAAAGSIANVLVGLLLFGVLRSPRQLSPRWRYFLWLFGAVSLLTPFGYLLYSGVGGVGDWAKVIDGARPAVVFRLLLIVSGAWLYFVVAPRVLMPPLDAFLGREAAVRAARARRLMLVPYFAGSCTLVAAGLLNPLGAQAVLISGAAAGFGGTSLLAWYRPRAPLPATGAPLDVERSTPWIAAAILAIILFVFVLGRGIGRA